jgi:hypothetical protein
MTPARRLATELLGTALLLAAVVGSGIMGERLSGGNVALALLANTLAGRRRIRRTRDQRLAHFLPCGHAGRAESFHDLRHGAA